MTKKILALFCLLLILAIMAGCSGNIPANTQSAADPAQTAVAGDADGTNTQDSMSPDQTPDDANVQAVVDGEASYLGQVKAIEGNQITLAVSPMRDSGFQPPANRPDRSAAPSQERRPALGDGQMPDQGSPRNRGDGSDGRPPDRQGPGNFEFSEEMTITVLDSTAITIQSDAETTPGALDAIAAGDMLSFTILDGNVTQIVIMRGGRMGGRGTPSP